MNRYRPAFLTEMARLYKKYNFVTQLHIGTYSDASRRKVRETGQSTGFGCMDGSTAVKFTGQVLNRLTELDHLPRTILYPLNPTQMEPFAALAAGFCDGMIRGRAQLGTPWQFNDQSRKLVERGEYSSDEKHLKDIIEGICYRNVKEYFGW